MTLGRRGRRNGTRLVLASIAAAGALAAAVAVSVAADPTETSTFGADGIATNSLGVHFDESEFWRVTARPDGGLVAQRDDSVESYLPDGAPDPAQPPRHFKEYSQVFPVSDGKSLVLSYGKLTRLNSDGSVDAGFGGGSVAVAGDADTVAELPSGKILVVGFGSGGTHQIISWITVQLVNPDGSIDRGLGRDGTLTLEATTYNEPVSRFEISPTADGGALVSGGRFLLRLRADGSPDPGFGDGGLVDTVLPVAGARVQADGSVAAVGWNAGAGRDFDLTTLRFSAAGKPDSSFGPNGIRHFDFGGHEVAKVALWAADGSVIVGGRAEAASPCPREEGCEEMPIAAAFDPAGNLDTTFGQGGLLRLTALTAGSEGRRSEGVTALARRPDGSVVAAGSAPPAATVAFLAAFSPGGVLLSGFGSAGIVSVRRPVPATQRFVGFAPLPDGKILAAGTSDVGIDDQPVLVRYAADGSLDPSFGNGAGYLLFGRSQGARGFAADDSEQVLMGIYSYPRNRLLWLRADDGSPVRSFGTDGAILLPKRIWINSLGFAGDGDAIVLASRDVSGPAEPGVLLRFHPSGKRDRTFGDNGRLDLRLPGGREVQGKALVANAGGRILVAGESNRRFVLASLRADGRPAPGFGPGGWSLVRAGGTVQSVALRRIGPYIYLAGAVDDEERHRVVLVRFDKKGHLDRTFGRRGRHTVTLSRPFQPKAILPTGKGVLVVLNQGPKPLLYFSPNGQARRRPVGPRAQYVDNLRATITHGQLVLGWNQFSRAIKRNVYYLAKRPLSDR